MHRFLFALVLAGCGAAAPTASEPATDPGGAPTDDGLTCEPVNYFCGCTWECALVRHDGDVWVRLDSEGEQQFVRDATFEVCGAEGCSAGLVMAGDGCAEVCPPSRAPMAGCHRVPGEPIDATGRPCLPDP
jgi:hypothetical protein